LQTILLLKSAFLCVFRFFGLSSFDTVTTLILSRLASFLPFFEVIPEIFLNFGFSTDFSTGRRVSGFRSHAEHGKRPENPVFPTNGSETAAPERRKKRKNSPTVPGNEDGADSPSPPNRQRHIQPQSQL